MEKIEKINKKEVREFWKLLDKDSPILATYPTFEDFWEDCEKLNNFPEEGYQKKERIAVIKALMNGKVELDKLLGKLGN
jgi:hypothetical protein